MSKLNKLFIEKILNRLDFIYNSELSSEFKTDFIRLIEKYIPEEIIPNFVKLSLNDCILITYGDSINNREQKSLSILNKFCCKYLANTFTIIHILPFFPFSSDDGFSVIDYRQVDPHLGDWSDIDAFKENFNLMIDFVINHTSAKSKWFEGYKKGIAPFSKYFIEASPDIDLSMVVRPRTSPLLTPVETNNGLKYVWTTFSADQIDLNFSSPEVLLEMTDIFLSYIQKGARVIRLDAIAFLWKTLETKCLHLPQTHEIVKLLRDIAEFINPGIIILTETNVPNAENLSYFGNRDEAHMVYQFNLPPLLAHALFTGNSEYLSNWAISLRQLPEGFTYLNFTASHDGIGVRPLEGIIPQNEIEDLLRAVKTTGGLISSRTINGNKEIPYELNITYFDILKTTYSGEDNFQLERFICSQTIMMGLKGIPAFYINSLWADGNNYEGLQKTGRARSINRKKWNLNELTRLIDNEGSKENKVFNRLIKLLKIRQKYSAFHPDSGQKIYHLSNKLFIFKRGTKDEELLCISNITNQIQNIEIEILSNLHLLNSLDLISNANIDFTSGDFKLLPYQNLWLKAI